MRRKQTSDVFDLWFVVQVLIFTLLTIDIWSDLMRLLNG